MKASEIMSNQEIKRENNSELNNTLNDNNNNDINVDKSLLLDRNYLIKLVDMNDINLRFVPQMGKSKAWTRFERIYYDNYETVYVKCKYCDDIIKHVRHFGTGGLLRHKCQQPVGYFQTEEPIDEQTNYGFNQNQEKSIHIQNNESFNREIVSQDNQVVDSFNDRNYLISLVESRDDRLRFETQSGKSDAWTRFERIFYDNFKTDYVKCKYCDDIIKHIRPFGTGGLLRHKCKAFVHNYESRHDNNEYIPKNTLKKRVINEKLMIQKLSHENKTLKLIVEKCMKMIDKCLCFNKYNSDQRKDINVLINGYNKWLFEFKDYELSVDNNNTLSEDSDYVKNKRSNDLSCDGHESDTKSDNDSQYKPYLENNKNRLKLNSIRNVTKLQVIRNNMKQKVTNAIKRKYAKNVKREKDPKQRLVCEWPGCDKVFRYNQHLKEHRDCIHLGIKNWRCDWPGCEDLFMTKNQLNAHICKYHTNEKPFKCDECEYTTQYKAHLSRHKRIHSEEKPCVCDWPGCEFRTNFEVNLTAHKLRHSCLKPYKCSWPSCECSFRQSHHLKAHLLKHTGEKPVLCQFNGCDRRFSSRQAMRFHMQKVHQNSNYVLTHHK